MASYTVDIYTLLKDTNFKVFDFNYNFYDEQHKEEFEEKFINYYMFNEIGFETVVRFKHYLKEKLNRIAPYYEQLYKTELRCLEGDIDFMLNKDLHETINVTGNNTSNVTTNDSNTSTTSATSLNNSKESYLDNGNASLDLTDGNLTGINETTGQGNTTNTVSGNSSSDTTNNNNQQTELISKGNIGVTSSAELLKQWRQILINIDEMIIEECRDLFMMIY